MRAMRDFIFYPSLEDIASLPGSEKPMRVCIVTPDLLGPVKNGGIGTACGYLACALAESGHDVSVLFCQTGADDIDNDWTDVYKAKGIHAVNAAVWQAAQGTPETFPGLPHLAMSKTVYDWLAQAADFDLILFMDWQGSGFYAMHAKACGLSFANTALVTVIHSPSYWHSINNGAVAANPLEACLWHMERRSISMADAVISPSRYMLKWVNDRLCSLPSHAYWQPNLLKWDDSMVHASDAPIEEIVFFGRLEYRKGLEQFCAAMDRLAKIGKLPPRITFLGKCSWLGREHSALYIARRASKWRQHSEIRLETQKGHKEAVEYICGPGRLAVMPSLADNSPYTVYECLVAGVPFLARDVGGISEFLPEEQRSRFLFGDNPAELAEKIAAATGKPPQRGTLAINMAANACAWSTGLSRLAALCSPRRHSAGEPLISVILTHYNRPQLLRQAVDSLMGQEYRNFELILADDGSTDPQALALLRQLEPAFLERGWRILRLPNGHAAAARNRGARSAKGDWLLFFDDDNVAMPHMMETCAKAAVARTGGYIPIMFQVFEGNKAPNAENMAEVFLPTGDAVAYSAMVNTLSDTTALVHRKTFERVGGFREDYGLGHEDFELFLRLALLREPCAIIPRPLFWYRKSRGKASVQLNTNADLNRMRSLRPFLEILPPDLAELALMTHGMGGMLHMYPEPDLGRYLDMPLNYKADAGSAANMAGVAAMLAAGGEGSLAEQILLSLPENERPARAGLLHSRALAAARKGDLKGIRSALADFDEMGLSDSDAGPICQAILDNLEVPAEKLRADIIEKLRGLGEKSPLAWLLLAQNALEHDKAGEFVHCFLEGLAAAETVYLQARPDVGEAIKSKAFVCGLQHFVLHGEADNMAWPERPMFRRLLRRSRGLERQIHPAHMRMFGYDDEELAGNLLHALRGE